MRNIKELFQNQIHDGHHLLIVFGQNAQLQLFADPDYVCDLLDFI